MAKDDKKSGIHQGHRKRMRDRFIKSGNISSFQDHELVEMLLYYVYMRADTNEKAHELLAEYGSVYNLLNASPTDLMNRGGLSESGAVLLSLIPHMMTRYMDSSDIKGQYIRTTGDAIRHLSIRIAGSVQEKLYVMHLNSRKRVIKSQLVSEGTDGEVCFYPENIVEQALIYKSSFVIIGHNHPSGFCAPSESDMETTCIIKRGLDSVSIKLLDHIIICGSGRYFSFAENGLL